MINVRHVPIPPVSESSMYAAHLWTGQCQACQLTALWLLEKFPQPLALLKADCLLTNFSRHWQENLWICINLFFPFPVLRSKKSLEGASVLSHFENMSRTSPPAQLFSLFFHFTSHKASMSCGLHQILGLHCFKRCSLWHCGTLWLYSTLDYSTVYIWQPNRNTLEPIEYWIHPTDNKAIKTVRRNVCRELRLFRKNEFLYDSCPCW